MIKVSYGKNWDNEGTFYNQVLSMSLSEFSALNTLVEIEIEQGLPNKNKYVSTPGYEIFLKPLNSESVLFKDVYLAFLNNTQLRFIKHELDFLDIPCVKRILDRNTVIAVR